MITSVNDTRFNSKEIGEIQSGILQGVYTKEYPSSVCDTNSAIQQTRDGTQKVLFWGNNIEDISNYLGGTVALVKSDLPEALEMCRAGATIETGEGFSAIKQLMNHFKDSKDSFSSIYVTTRNCNERKSMTGEMIKGGKAIFTMFNRLKEFKFFGFAPWYIMPGGKIELLDIRVLHRYPNQVIQSLQSSEVYVGSERIAGIIHDMLNQYGIEPQFHVSGSVDIDNISGVYNTDYSELGQKNSLFFYPGNTSTDSPRDVSTFFSDKTPIKSIRVNLLNKDEAGIQRLAEEQGFRFTGIIPTNGKIYGFWTRINHELTFADPAYVSEGFEKIPDFQYDIYKFLIH